MPIYNPFERDSSLPQVPETLRIAGLGIGVASTSSLAELRDALTRAVDGQIDAVRQRTIQASDTMGELVRTDVLESGRLVAARKIHADLERLTGELERLMTARVEP